MRARHNITNAIVDIISENESFVEVKILSFGNIPQSHRNVLIQEGETQDKIFKFNIRYFNEKYTRNPNVIVTAFSTFYNWLFG